MVVVERRVIRNCVEEQAFLMSLHRVRRRYHQYVMDDLWRKVEESRRRVRRYRFMDRRIVSGDRVDRDLRERTYVHNTVAGIFLKRLWLEK